MRTRTTTFGWLAALLIAAGCGDSTLRSANAAERHALLIGIGDYQSDRIRDLDGPPEDVSALHRVLEQRWGFSADNIKALVDAQATRANILNEIDALARRSRPGDEVLIYFSGHGTSRQDRDNTATNLPSGTGAILPYDFQQQSTPEATVKQLIVGRFDLQPRLRALDTDRRVLVLFDACFSGNAVRSLGRGSARSQRINLDGAFAGFHGRESEAPSAYPYKNTLFLAASGAAEEAWDIDRDEIKQHPTFDGHYHGAFSDALLRALNGKIALDQNHDGQLTLGELSESVRQFVATTGYPQDPQVLPALAEDRQSLRQRRLFGIGTPADGTPLPAPRTDHTVAALRVRFDGPEALRSALADLDGIEWVETNADLVLTPQGNEVKIATAGNDPIATVPASDSATLRMQVQRRSQWHRLIATARARQQFGASLGLDDATASATAVEGQTIDISVKPERDGYLLLLDLFSDGSVHVLYPDSAQEANTPLSALRAKSVFATDVVPPFGLDHLIALVFPKKPPGLDGWICKTIDLQHDTLSPLMSLLDASPGAVAEFPLKTYPKNRVAP